MSKLVAVMQHVLILIDAKLQTSISLMSWANKPSVVVLLFIECYPATISIRITMALMTINGTT